METQLFAKESACAAIVETGHALIEKKLVAGSWGNISCRIDAQNIAITPSGHGYETLTPEDVVHYQTVMAESLLRASAFLPPN